MSADFWADAEIIHAYSRAQAIEDGVLVDVSELAREAGIKFPVAMTSGAYEDTVAWSEAHDRRKGGYTAQDPTGRLWDVLNMLIFAIRRAPTGAHRVDVTLYRVPPQGRGTTPRKTRLVASVGPGDGGEPVFTLLLPGED